MSAEPEPERSSRAAGGCVLVALVGIVMAVVYAASTEAGVLTTVGAATTAVWWSVRRPVSDSSATPPPLPKTPSGDVYAGDTDEVARVEWSPEGVRCTIHPVRVEVTER